MTPTYNRAYTLTKLYLSLKKQTLFNFEWIIIDDGSNDNTYSLVNGWINEVKPFIIRYYKINNGGKHRALNYGVPKAKGEFIFIVDSDDFLTSDAIEVVTSWISSINDDPCFAGVAGLRGYDINNIIGEFPKNRTYVDCKNSDRYKYKLSGDKAEIYRKEILMNYPFKEFNNENFISEGSVWNKIAYDGYKIRWFNKIIYIGNYLNDGLTHKEENLKINNFKGYSYTVAILYKSLPKPYNLVAVSTYINIAKKLDLTDKNIIDNISINTIDYYLSKFIYIVKKVLKKYANDKKDN